MCSRTFKHHRKHFDKQSSYINHYFRILGYDKKQHLSYKLYIKIISICEIFEILIFSKF